MTQEMWAGLQEKRVIEETETGYVVTLTDADATVRVAFDHITHSRHRLDADVTVTYAAGGFNRDPFTERLNLLSGSNRTEMRRSLDDLLPMGKGFWTGILNQAITICQQTIKTRDPSISLKDAPDVKDDGYIVYPVLLAHGPTVWFGDGGTAKSFQAMALSKAICQAGTYLGEQCAWRGVLYVDYETDAATWKRRVTSLEGDDPEDFYYWPGMGVPISDMVDGLRRVIAAKSIGLVVIDSAVPACGGKPEEADTARSYFAALSQLRVPTLTISHVTKGGEDKYPFGSVMWNNLARLTWNVKCAEEDNEEVLHVGLYNRKINDGKRHRHLGVRVVFGERVSIRREQLSMPELMASASLPERIRAALRQGKKSAKELQDELGVSQALLAARLAEMRDVTNLSTEGRQRAVDGSLYWWLSA